jgi:hypothetical protein
MTGRIGAEAQSRLSDALTRNPARSQTPSINCASRRRLPGPRHRDDETIALPWIALVASAIVRLQNLPSVTGLGWALIQGAGILSLLPFVPAAIALSVL